jgi:hypothetical protein
MGPEDKTLNFFIWNKNVTKLSLNEIAGRGIVPNNDVQQDFITIILAKIFVSILRKYGQNPNTLDVIL